MNIQINGEQRQLKGRTLADALSENGFSEAVVATAVNGEFVPEVGRSTCTLSAGDQIEVLAPMQGG